MKNNLKKLKNQFSRQHLLSCLLSGCLLSSGFSMMSYAEQFRGQALVIQNPLEVRIQKTVTDHVQKQLVHYFQEQHIDNVTPRVDILALPMAGAHLSLEGLSIEAESNLARVYSEREVIRVTLKNELGETREIGVPVKIVIERPVWVAKSMVTANQPLSSQFFSLRTMDVSHQLTHSIGTEKNLSDYIARVNMMPGDILDDRRIIIPPDIRYNDDVSILISSGNGMNLTVPGTAMASGRIGETIRVRQQVFKTRYYSAKIIDKNKVLVEI